MESEKGLRGGAQYSYRPSSLLPGRWWLVKIEQSDRTQPQCGPVRVCVCVYWGIRRSFSRLSYKRRCHFHCGVLTLCDNWAQLFAATLYLRNEWHLFSIFVAATLLSCPAAKYSQFQEQKSQPVSLKMPSFCTQLGVTDIKITVMCFK